MRVNIVRKYPNRAVFDKLFLVLFLSDFSQLSGAAFFVLALTVAAVPALIVAGAVPGSGSGSRPRFSLSYFLGDLSPLFSRLGYLLPFFKALRKIFFVLP